MGTELMAPREYVECQEKIAKDTQRTPNILLMDRKGEILK